MPTFSKNIFLVLPLPPTINSYWGFSGHRRFLTLAAREFYKDGKYHLEGEGLQLTAQQWTDMLANWCDKYPIISIEDAMAEGDWDGWKVLTDRLARKVQIVGDDLFVTNTKIFQEGIETGIANSSSSRSTKLAH